MSHSKICVHRLSIQVETSDEWCSKGLVQRLVLFNIFVSRMDSGIE